MKALGALLLLIGAVGTLQRIDDEDESWIEWAVALIIGFIVFVMLTQ